MSKPISGAETSSPPAATAALIGQLKWRHGREFFIISSGQAFAAIGSLVGVRFLTDAMPPSEYGLLALAMAVVTVVQQTLVIPVNSTAIRFYASAQNELASYLGALRWMVGRISATTAILGTILVVVFLLRGDRTTASLTGASTLYSIVLGAVLAVDGIQNAARRRAVTAWHDAAAIWLRFLLAALLLHMVGSGSSALAMAGYALSAVLVLFSQTLVFPPLPELTRWSRDVDTRWRVPMLAFATPLALFGLMTAIQLGADRWALGLFDSTAATGRYAVLVQLGYYPVTMLTNVVLQLVTPIVFGRVERLPAELRRSEALRMVALLLTGVILVTALATAFAWAFNDLIFRLFVDPAYRDVAPALPLLALTGGFVATGQAASLALLAEQRAAALVRPRLVSTVATVIGSAFGARAFGVTGVAVASAAGALLFACLVAAVAWRGANPSVR